MVEVGYKRALQSMHEGKLPVAEPGSVFGRLSDDEWLQVLVRSIDQPVIDGVELPGFPPPEFQVASVGSAGAPTLTEAFNFWRVVRTYASRLGVELGPGSRVLDFGCGWGRTARFFLRDLHSTDVWGIDVGEDMYALCQQLFRHGRFQRVAAWPPTTLPASSFDVVYAYSVFSHLNEAIHLAWLEELARVLRPGGVLVVTTQGRRFIDYCEQVRRQGHPAGGWHEALSRSFVDRTAALAAYDRGEFLHTATGGGADRPPTFYGESLIPRQYVEREWTRVLEFVDFRDDPSFLPQALVVMRRGTIEPGAHV